MSTTYGALFEGIGMVTWTDPPDPSEYADLDPHEDPPLCGGSGEIEVGRFQDPQTGVWETEIFECEGCEECQ